MIYESYTLFSHIPVYEDGKGNFYTGNLWAKDLLLHMGYIANFHLCCPVSRRTGEIDADTLISGLQPKQVSALRLRRGWLSVFLNLIPDLMVIWSSARRSAIVHAGGAGWPFPLAYYLLLLRPVLKAKWVMVIESTFWMRPSGMPKSLRSVMRESLDGFLIRRCLKKADIRIFTSDWYREVLFGGNDNCLIAPAVWINESDIRPELGASRHEAFPLRLVFPARLVPEKGVETVLDAIALYDQNENPSFELDVVGSGSEVDRVRGFISNYAGRCRLRYLEPVAYGPDFFALLRQYDGVVIASLTEEQPRIAFDAFSQGLPCIASRTHGNASVIEDGITGYFFEPGNSQDLARLIVGLAAAPEIFLRLRPAALSVARQNSHQQMHRNREAFLKQCIGC